MKKEMINELTSKLEVIDNKLYNLLQKGGNDEKLVTKKKELLNQLYGLNNEHSKKKIS
jgi:hypothetical protein